MSRRLQLLRSSHHPSSREGLGIRRMQTVEWSRVSLHYVCVQFTEWKWRHRSERTDNHASDLRQHPHCAADTSSARNFSTCFCRLRSSLARSASKSGSILRLVERCEGLWLVVAIVQGVSFGEHTLVQNTGNQ